LQGCAGESNLTKRLLICALQVKPISFPVALEDRRITVSIDPQGNVLEVSNSPKVVFGFRPSRLLGRNLNNVINIFEELPVSGGKDRMDMEHVLLVMLQK
jgi:hypothetical protein